MKAYCVCPRLNANRFSLGAVLLALGCVLLAGCMPGRSFIGPLPPLSHAQAETAERLKRDVYQLADHIGERNIKHIEQYDQAADYIEESLKIPSISVTRQIYPVVYGVNGQGGRYLTFAGDKDGNIDYDSPYIRPGDELQEIRCYNLIGELTGTERPEEVVVIGAHYDSLMGTVGADDNTSGVAAVLELARRLAASPPPRTVRFLAFANEEPPFFRTPLMGSWRYAKSCRDAGDNIVAMMSIDGLGYFSDEPGSQQYPLQGARQFYPSKGDFVTFVGDTSLPSVVRRAIRTFRTTTPFPSEGIAAPRLIHGIGWSDHWSFWEHGYPASFMVTDTLPFRYAHYHRLTDTADRLDYERMARVVDGLEAVVRELAGEKVSR